MPPRPQTPTGLPDGLPEDAVEAPTRLRFLDPRTAEPAPAAARELTPEQRKLDVLKLNLLFTDITDPKDLDVVVQASEFVGFEAGESVIEAHGPSSDLFLATSETTIEVVCGEHLKIEKTLFPVHALGEFQFLDGAAQGQAFPSAATVRVREKTTFLKVPPLRTLNLSEASKIQLLTNILRGDFYLDEANARVSEKIPFVPQRLIERSPMNALLASAGEVYSESFAHTGSEIHARPGYFCILNEGRVGIKDLSGTNLANLQGGCIHEAWSARTQADSPPPVRIVALEPVKYTAVPFLREGRSPELQLQIIFALLSSIHAKTMHMNKRVSMGVQRAQRADLLQSTEKPNLAVRALDFAARILRVIGGTVDGARIGFQTQLRRQFPGTDD